VFVFLSATMRVPICQANEPMMVNVSASSLLMGLKNEIHYQENVAINYRFIYSKKRAILIYKGGNIQFLY